MGNYELSTRASSIDRQRSKAKALRFRVLGFALRGSCNRKWGNLQPFLHGFDVGVIVCKELLSRREVHAVVTRVRHWHTHDMEARGIRVGGMLQVKGNRARLVVSVKLSVQCLAGNRTRLVGCRV